MKITLRAGAVAFTISLVAAVAGAHQFATLTPEEAAKIRDAQDPSERIKVYIELEQARLDRFNQARNGYEGSNSDRGKYLNYLLGQYTDLLDEMKDWIDGQFDQQGDMRSGLQALLAAGPKQLDELRSFQNSSGPYAAEFGGALDDAMADLNDALDGASKGLSAQVKQFGELKQEQKAEARDLKAQRKEEEKRNKEEKKLLKKMEKKDKAREEDQSDSN